MNPCQEFKANDDNNLAPENIPQDDAPPLIFAGKGADVGVEWHQSPCDRGGEL
jgi:hypothetical protein